MTAISILLIDDSPTFLRYVTLFLQRHAAGIEIIGTAMTAEEGLTQARQRRPQIVLVDLKMPGMGGLEVIPQLRALKPEPGIIALTLYEESNYRRAALDAGSDEFVSKADVTRDLVPAIRSLASRLPAASTTG